MNYIMENASWRLETARRHSDIPNPKDYLIVEDKEDPATWHLPVSNNGVPNHRLMGGAYAALTVGYRGHKYEGPGKRDAMKKLKGLYEKEGLELPVH